MTAMTKDPQRLAACLTELMAAPDTADSVSQRAASLADRLDQTPNLDALIEEAQVFLRRHGVTCGDQSMRGEEADDQ